MAHPELEQFIGQGNERAWWIFTWKNVGGMVVGGYAGSSLGDLLGLSIAFVIAGVLLGYVLTRAKKGIMRIRRMGQAAWFYAMSLVTLPVVDSAVYYAIDTEDDDDPLMWMELMREDESL